MGLKAVWIRYIANKYGGTVTWDPETQLATVNFGSVGSKKYSLASAQYTEDGKMYIDDKEFIDDWGIKDSISTYSSKLKATIVFAIFDTGQSMIGFYHQRVTVANKEIDYSLTTRKSYTIASLSPDKVKRDEIVVATINTYEIDFYTGQTFSNLLSGIGQTEFFQVIYMFNLRRLSLEYQMI